MSGETFERNEKRDLPPGYADFCGAYIDSIDEVSEKAEDPEKEIQARRAGIKELATVVLKPKGLSWADLAEAGGYDEYLKKVEELCQYKKSLDEGEVRIFKWASDNDVTLTNVSGLTIFRGKGSLSAPSYKGTTVDEVLLSVTKEKAWSHQPFGGKRNEGEGAVASMLREFGEEAGWDSAVQLLRAFMNKEAFYDGFYVQKLSPNKALFIQSFAMQGANFDTSTFTSGSDSSNYVWGGPELLDAEEKGEVVSLTQQAEHQMKSVFGFNRPRSKFTHGDRRYYGDPTVDLLEQAVHDCQSLDELFAELEYEKSQNDSFDANKIIADIHLYGEEKKDISVIPEDSGIRKKVQELVTR